MRRRRDPTERLHSVLASESVAELTASLDDSSPVVARAAIARLVRVGGPGALPRLRERLLGGQLELVADIARALRSTGDPTVVDLAIAGLGGERYLSRLAAARALQALGDPRARDALHAALRDQIGGVRAAVLDALAELGHHEYTAVQCSTLLTDADAQVRLAAVRAVRRTGRHPGTLLAAVVHDPDRRVRLELGKHLATLPAEAAAGLLEDPDLRVREAAASGAGREQLEALPAMLVADRSSDVRCAAAQSLTEIVDESTAGVLLPALDDPDPIVRAAVLRALRAALGDAGAARLLRIELRAPRAHRRRAAIYALGHLHARAAGDDVARLVEDPDPEVRLAVVHTAAALHRAPQRLLWFMASDSDPAVRNGAEASLEQLEGIRSREEVI